jgi:hypothetical protein
VKIKANRFKYYICFKYTKLELCFPQDEAKEASPSNIDFYRLRAAGVKSFVKIMYT